MSVDRSASDISSRRHPSRRPPAGGLLRMRANLAARPQTLMVRSAVTRVSNHAAPECLRAGSPHRAPVLSNCHSRLRASSARGPTVSRRLRVRALPASRPRQDGGRREGRVPFAPAAPVRERVHGAGTTGTSRTIRPSLREWFTAYTFSPRGPAVLPPSSARSSTSSTNLASAPGCQDQTISPSAPAPAVHRRRHVHRIPHSTSVTTRTPLAVRRDGRDCSIDFRKTEALFFWRSRSAEHSASSRRTRGWQSVRWQRRVRWLAMQG
jgi:hypothetical protein